MRGISGVLARFRKDDGGTVAIIFALCCICLFGIAGLAVDTARYYNLTSKVQDALDAAALAGAKHLIDEDMSDDEIETLTETHFTSAIATLGVKPGTAPDLTVDIDRVASTVEAKSKLVVRSLFGPILLRPRFIDIEQSSKVVFDMKKIELSMVLDITGSMNDNGKLSDMKSAAGDIIDQLMDNAARDDSVRIAVAPFSAAVNAGVLADSVSAVPPSGPRQCSWQRGRGWVCRNAQGADIDNCVIERQGANAATDAPPVGADALPVVSTLPYGNYTCPTSSVVPLKDATQKDEIKNIINGYQAMGATAGHIGAAWGWYLLSPNWNSVLPDDSEPADYEDKEVTKSMIFMTDGVFNTHYIGNGSAGFSAQVNQSYQDFQNICAAAKNKKISIYTIGFALNDARAISELQQCASSPSSFFDAKTGADLKKAFKAIGDKLNALRVAS